MNDSFADLLNIHLKYIHQDMGIVTTELTKRSTDHDLDKFFDPEIFDIYTRYFPDLKKIEYGTEEYFKFERDNFSTAHQKHAQNRHHFYSSRNHQTEANLIDLLEAVIDINASSKQYNSTYSIEQTLQSIKGKGIMDYDLQELIKNTIEFINSKGEDYDN